MRNSEVHERAKPKRPLRLFRSASPHWKEPVQVPNAACCPELPHCTSTSARTGWGPTILSRGSRPPRDHSTLREEEGNEVSRLSRLRTDAFTDFRSALL